MGFPLPYKDEVCNTWHKRGVSHPLKPKCFMSCWVEPNLLGYQCPPSWQNTKHNHLQVSTITPCYSFIHCCSSRGLHNATALGEPGNVPPVQLKTPFFSWVSMTTLKIDLTWFDMQSVTISLPGWVFVLFSQNNINSRPLTSSLPHANQTYAAKTNSQQKCSMQVCTGIFFAGRLRSTPIWNSFRSLK